MDFGLSGKTALVTGGSRGLGRHSALALAREGCNVAICARSRESLDQTIKDLQALGIEALGVQADVTTEEGTSRVVEETLSALGPVDALVNNAGDAIGDDFDTADDAAWAFTFELILFSGIRLTRLSLPHMKRQKWGRIINVSSIWGREYGPALTYVTAKAALIAFSKTLAVELADSGVTVNTIAPGSIEFPGGVWDDFRKGNSPEIVEDFYYLEPSDGTLWVAGTDWRLGCLSRLQPDRADDRCLYQHRWRPIEIADVSARGPRAER